MFNLKNLLAMKNRRKKIKKNREIAKTPKKNIDDLIDELAYLDENKNMQKSKRFLDDMYILDLE
ncbi:hypothetical protein EG353_18080 [Chryseobacterium shandongense]|uniref:Uncharacterized protein n=2 Tax=Chryseobacterium group TaxID=2782232 RepID=A0ABM7BEI3_9FLAO|nr:hypothetical protein EG353_18080 [Chryseobacterium shandongense]